MELNAPFYSWPTVATVNSWIRQAGRREFVYTVKVCDLITHVKRFAGTKELVRDFGLITDLLGPLMGCFIFQLPPSFHYTPARMKKILGQLDHRRRNVVEFRHKSWWNEAVYGAFRETGTVFCSCSGPRLPDELIKTADDIYIRFHGTQQWYRYDYTKEELAVWAKRIDVCGAKTVWAYFNNHRVVALQATRFFRNPISPRGSRHVEPARRLGSSVYSRIPPQCSNANVRLPISAMPTTRPSEIDQSSSASTPKEIAVPVSPF